MGSKVVYVPTEAHWKSRAENLMHRTRVELAAVFHEFPTLSNSFAVKAALKRINSRVLSKFGVSRREIQKGRPCVRNDFQEILLSAPYPLTPSWLQLEKRRAAAALEIQAFDRAKVRDCVRRAIKSKRCKATNICHGDEFLFWREGEKAKSSRGWQGPAICIGVSGAVVIGWYAGQVVTVHITRSVVTKRHPDGERVFIPPAELKVPLPVAKEDLLVPMSGDENDFFDEDEETDGNEVDDDETNWNADLDYVDTPKTPNDFRADEIPQILNDFRADELPRAETGDLDDLVMDESTERMNETLPAFRADELPRVETGDLDDLWMAHHPG